MNTTKLEVWIVNVAGRTDPIYVFTNLSDAEMFATAVGYDNCTIESHPLIPGGGAYELIEQEREAAS